MSAKGMVIIEGFQKAPFKVLRESDVPDYIGSLRDKCSTRAGEFKRGPFSHGVPKKYAEDFFVLAQQLEILYNSLYPEDYKRWRNSPKPFPINSGTTNGEEYSAYTDEEVEDANADRS